MNVENYILRQIQSDDDTTKFSLGGKLVRGLQKKTYEILGSFTHVFLILTNSPRSA